MCLIIIKDGTEAPSPSTIREASAKNPHGLGVIWLDTFELQRFEKSDPNILINTDRDYIAHYRYATVGVVGRRNTHPFYIDKQNVLFQNGTNYNLGNDDITDTEALALVLGQCNREVWQDILEMTDSRYVTVDLKKREYEIYNLDKWDLDDKGNYYSKKQYTYVNQYSSFGTAGNSEEHIVREYYNGDWSAYYDDMYYDEFTGATNLKSNVSDDLLLGEYEEDGFQNNDFMAVYGTLKKGKGNNYFMKGCDFVSEGKTVDYFPMYANGIPYVFNKAGSGYKIKVEVYRVPHTELPDIDSLEGHPYLYKRELTPVKLANGEIKNCWLYFYQNEPQDWEMDILKCISEY